MLFDEDFIDDIIEHSPPPLVSHAAVAERGPEDADREESDERKDPADRGDERRHHGDDPYDGNG